MSDLDVQDAAANADNMVNPAFLAASMIEERAPDIVEALNDMPSELAVAVLLHLPPDHAIEVLDQPGLDREPALVTLMPREAAAKLLAGVTSTYTVQQTLDYIRDVESSRESVYAIYVLDPLSKKLVKTIALRRLITGDPQAPVLSVARPGRLITATPLMDREDVARLISKYDLLAVPRSEEHTSELQSPCNLVC